MKLLALLALIFIAFLPFARGQITGPASVDFALGSYQVTAWNVAGTPMSSFGWNLHKKAYLNRPINATVKVDSTSGNVAFYRTEINYFGVVDTVYNSAVKGVSFWLPVGASGIPDSLFYIAPNSTISAGDEFAIGNTKIKLGDFYSFRLIFSSDTLKGKQSLTSQPVWVGGGVSSFTFGIKPVSAVAAVYRTSYSLTHGGPYLAFASSDTLADSLWTIDSTSAGVWNYKAVTGIDVSRWMQVERIGKVAADTVVITGESVHIQSP